MLFVIVGVVVVVIIVAAVSEAYFKCIRSRCGKGKQKTSQDNNKSPPKPGKMIFHGSATIRNCDIPQLRHFATHVGFATVHFATATFRNYDVSQP